MVEVGAEWTDAPRGGSHKSEGEIYDGLHTVDGQDISSRKKRREYMKHNGLTDPTDYANTWKSAADERAKAFSGEAPGETRGRKEAIARAYETLSRGRRA